MVKQNASTHNDRRMNEYKTRTSYGVLPTYSQSNQPKNKHVEVTESTGCCSSSSSKKKQDEPVYDSRRAPAAKQYETVHHPTAHKTVRHPTAHRTVRHPTAHKTVRHPTAHETGHRPTAYETGHHPTAHKTGHRPTAYEKANHPTAYETGHHPTAYETVNHPTAHEISHIKNDPPDPFYYYQGRIKKASNRTKQVNHHHYGKNQVHSNRSMTTNRQTHYDYHDRQAVQTATKSSCCTIL